MKIYRKKKRKFIKVDAIEEVKENKPQEGARYDARKYKNERSQVKSSTQAADTTRPGVKSSQ